MPLCIAPAAANITFTFFFIYVVFKDFIMSMILLYDIANTLSGQLFV